MTSTRSGSADNSGSNTRFPSLDCSRTVTERRLRVLALLTDELFWKKRVAEKLGETPQTIGRDINSLHADGLLAPEFVVPAYEAHYQYIAFRTTEQGGEALSDFLTCKNCGEVVDTRSDCVHDYVPVREAVDTDGGER